jgi:hypothetical protein
MLSLDVAEFLYKLVSMQSLNAGADDFLPTAILIDKAKRELRNSIEPPVE